MMVKWQLNNSEVCLLEGFCQIRALTRKIARIHTHTRTRESNKKQLNDLLHKNHCSTGKMQFIYTENVC